jgi:hypothetical protein
LASFPTTYPLPARAEDLVDSGGRFAAYVRVLFSTVNPTILPTILFEIPHHELSGAEIAAVSATSSPEPDDIHGTSSCVSPAFPSLTS